MAERRVAVLFGGPSAEHEISIQSAVTVVQGLREGGLAVLPVRLHETGPWSFGRWLRPFSTLAVGSPGPEPGDALLGSTERPLSAARGAARLALEADVVFPCVHGRYGEDGILQGFLEALGVPYVGSGVLGSSLTMDKQRAKEVLSARTELALVRSLVIERWRWQQDSRGVLTSLADWPLPTIVKPAGAGSSVGLCQVDQPDQWPEALQRALEVRESYGAMVEACVRGDEVTCLVLGNPETGLRALPPVLIRPRNGALFDYAAKYEPGGAEEICPAPLEAGVLRRVEEDAMTACRALDVRGLGRVDFILDEGRPVFLEVNTMPGFTTGSLAPRAARASGMSLADLFVELVSLALQEPVEQRSAVAGAS